MRIGLMFVTHYVTKRFDESAYTEKGATQAVTCYTPGCAVIKLSLLYYMSVVFLASC